MSFWAANALFASFMGITLIIPLFIENQWGGTALQAGLALLPGTVASFIVNPLAGWLVDRIGARPVVVVASVFLAVGAVSMAFIDEATPFWAIVALQGVRATGVSGLIGPLTSWGMADLPHEIMTDGSSFGTAVPSGMCFCWHGAYGVCHCCRRIGGNVLDGFSCGICRFWRFCGNSVRSCRCSCSLDVCVAKAKI